MGGAHLAQVVEVVLVMDPAVVGGHAVRAVGDVPGIHAQTVVELALEELEIRDTGRVTILPTLPESGVRCKSEEGLPLRRHFQATQWTTQSSQVPQPEVRLLSSHLTGGETEA